MPTSKILYLHTVVKGIRERRPLYMFLWLPLLTGILMWAAWPPLPTALPAFIGFVPLFLADLAITDRYKNYTGLKVWSSVYTGLFLWNAFTTWWVSNATFWGGFFAILANAALMTVPFMLSRRVRLRFGKYAGYLAFAAFWLSFEFIHLRWEFTWPWLTLGNVFAAQYKWVQWYSITGVCGGTLWVIIGNLIITELCTRFIFSDQSTPLHRAFIYRSLTAWALLIIIPVSISLIMYSNYTEKGTPVRTTVLQPNFDVEYEKFMIPVNMQMEKMIDLSMQKVDDQTDFLVWPETAIQEMIWMHKINYSRSIRMLDKAIDSFPNLTCVVGISGFEQYDYDKTATTRMNIANNPVYGKPDTTYFDAFNTAVALTRDSVVGYYHKSKLVPGPERMPYPQYLKWLNDYTIDLGGISGSLGTQKERTVFFNAKGIGVAPVICYESVFGEFVTDYIKNGASLIFIITNDGWWGDTDGYKQHCMYASLRSIENRRSLARSANTGISCFINQRGDISQAQGWDVDAVITADLPANNEMTFYTKNGDFIARFALLISGGILLMMMYVRIKKGKLS